MGDNYRAQIYNNQNSKETEELLEIWQNRDIAEWDEEVFEIVKGILLERLGYVPPQSIEIQISKIISNIEGYLKNKELDKALRECELAIQMKPDSAIAYNYRGEIYNEMGQLENALTNYRKVIQLDANPKNAWKNMLRIESEIEEEFEESIAKQHLDQALEYAYNEEPEKALEECETAKLTMPSIAIAYNYLGLILQTLEQLESAIDSYLKAVQLNPRFYAARENLANARVSWEEEQYHLFSSLSLLETQETIVEFDETQVPETDELLPQWLYMDEKSYLIVGWPGHRNRQGRSGYDPIDRNAEQAHMQGVMIHLLLLGKFRTGNPIYLVFMACVGFLYFLFGVLPFTLGNSNGVLAGIINSPYLVIGIALLINVYLSLKLEKAGEYEDNGYTFFYIDQLHTQLIGQVFVQSGNLPLWRIRHLVKRLTKFSYNRYLSRC
jgi:tetratricopeptide (TPR) repeat protein